MAKESTYKREFINNRPPELTDAAWWADIRFDASDNNPDFVGLNKLTSASTAIDDWKIYKFTYSGNDVTRIQLAYGSWDGRVALF